MSRTDGTNPRATGQNPRALGQSPRQQAPTREDFIRLERKLDRIIEALAKTAPPTPTGVIIDGDRRFLPGTGLLDDHRPLSPAAQAALAQLESENP